MTAQIVQIQSWKRKRLDDVWKRFFAASQPSSDQQRNEFKKFFQDMCTDLGKDEFDELVALLRDQST